MSVHTEHHPQCNSRFLLRIDFCRRVTTGDWGRDEQVTDEQCEMA